MQKKIFVLGCAVLAIMGCEKHDPILPGTRSAIFNTNAPQILDKRVENLPLNIDVVENVPCPYRQDTANVVWNGDKKIFSGFPTANSVKSNQTPVCSGNYVYAGLTTGELVKINGKTSQIVWIADIFSPSNMTGGASVLDIIAPVVVNDNSVYVGGLGNAFCRINASNGNKLWCANIGTAYSFIVTASASFVVATDGNLYAIRNKDGAIYWRAELKKPMAPTYKDKTIIVGRQKFDAETGNLL